MPESFVKEASRRVPRRAKIVCTLGPATAQPDRIRALIEAGMDVARLNFSHGNHQTHRNTFEMIRTQSRELESFTAVMQDLQGPKIRLGKLPENVSLEAGQEVILYPEGATPNGNADQLLPVSAEIAETLSKDARKGHRILFDDGKVLSRVVDVRVPEIRVCVEIGGVLSSHKGMNLPDTPLSLPCVTEKDLADLRLGLELGVDAVALSFVRSAADIEFVKKFIEKAGSYKPLVIAKIEREEAVELHESIIDVADGLLIARGDMAVELGAGRVPIVQKALIHACNELGVPVITATQMLESMIHSPTPTRAEANDVANAVFDGTDALMLSGETASGQYPIEAARTMAQIILQAESASDRYSVHPTVQPMPGVIVDSIEFSAARIAHHVGAVAIATITHSGTAARALAKYRPDKSIVAIMDNEESLRKLALVWGVRGVVIPKIVQTDDLFKTVEDVLKDYSWARDGDLIVVTAGIPSLKRGTTNTIKVHRVGAPIERVIRK